MREVEVQGTVGARGAVGQGGDSAYSSSNQPLDALAGASTNLSKILFGGLTSKENGSKSKIPCTTKGILGPHSGFKRSRPLSFSSPGSEDSSSSSSSKKAAVSRRVYNKSHPQYSRTSQRSRTTEAGRTSDLSPNTRVALRANNEYNLSSSAQQASILEKQKKRPLQNTSVAPGANDDYILFSSAQQASILEKQTTPEYHCKCVCSDTSCRAGPHASGEQQAQR